MSAGFSPHNPTAHLQEKPSAHEHHDCSCGDGPKMEISDPTALDELITIRDVGVDAETQQVRLTKAAGKASEQKQLEETVGIINDFSQYLCRAPFPHCPPVPTMIQQNPRSMQISSMKEEGNVAFKANNFPKAIEIYSLAAELAGSRPLFEPSIWVREELSIILCNRAAAYSSAKMFVEALCDAEVVVQLKRNWSKGHFRRAKALQGLGRIDDAKDAVLNGLEFEPDNPDLRGLFAELSE